MALSVNNPIFRQIFGVVFLALLFSLSAFAQDHQPTLEAALAITDPPARIEALQKFLQAQPDSSQAETARAELTRAFAYVGETQLAEKNLDAALQSFKRAIAAFPKQVDDKFFDEVAVKIPLAVSVRGYRTEAILLAREIEARFVDDAKRLTALGEFYLSVEAPGEALRALKTAVKRAPDNARIYRALGAAHRVNLNLEEAAAQYQQAIKADPKDARAYFELGNLRRARGSYEAAINLYDYQLRLEPEHVPSLKGLALCHIAQGKEARAEELLAQAAKVTNTDLKQDFYFQTQLALTYLARGNVAKARQAAEAALAAEPRFSWARIAAAEVDLAEGKYFEAERNVIAAMKYANFPTLHFTLGKIYVAVEDFEGALAEFNKAFSYKEGKFQTRLGGVIDVKAESVAELLAPERQASMFQAEPSTTDVEFKLAENLTRFEDAVRGGRQSSSALLSSILINQKANKAAAANLEKATEDFVETEGSRKAFRWLYAAERLTQSGQALELALKLTAQALEAAETATAPDGSLRDYPNYDRDGRLRVFRGRTLTLRGRALVKLGRAQEAITTLEQALESYGTIPERKRAQWQLALAKESAGQNKEALELYIAAYEPPEQNSAGSDLNRAVIESLYRKVNGSLDGLNERIGKAREAELVAVPKPTVPDSAPPENTEAKPRENPPTETTAPPSVTTPDSTAKPKATSEKPVTETKTETNTNAPVVLPDARVIALIAGELANTETQPEIALEVEDAPPLAAANTDKLAEASNSTPVVLPESKPISLLLAGEEWIATEVRQELAIEVEDAPLPDKSATKTEVATVREEPKPTETVIPVVLPNASAPQFFLLPTLEAATSNTPELASALLEVDDPRPITEAKPAGEPIAGPRRKTTPKSASPRTQLSDSRVAEIERSIEAGSSRGKKGSGTDAIEETASGHREGDTPVRIGKSPEPVSASGESDPRADTKPKTNTEGGTTALPAEVELRAKTIGQSAGKLSVGAAMEIEAPEKPASGGRKGMKKTTDESESNSPSNTRPRRVKDKPEDVPPPKKP